MNHPPSGLKPLPQCSEEGSAIETDETRTSLIIAVSVSASLLHHAISQPRDQESKTFGGCEHSVFPV